MIDLRLGDCLDVMRGIPDASIDAVITDPPYTVGNARVPIRGNGVSKRITVSSSSIGQRWDDSLDWMDRIADLHPKQWVVFCSSWMLGEVCLKVKQYAKLQTVFVWRKINAPPMTRNVPRYDCEFIVWARADNATNGRAREFRSMVLDVPMPQAGCFASERVLMEDSKAAAHPAQKPIAIIEPFIERLTNEGQTVLDPFAGTGTTGVACVKLGRSFIGIEINEAYYAIAQRRIQEAQAQMTMPMVTA